MQRRHDIDALRALAFALVILYHVGMYYVDGWGWHLKSPHAAAWLQWPMRALNLWRLDVLFVLSGIALGLSGRGLGRWGLVRSRSVRLLVPLAFGMAVVVPYQPYAQGVANGLVAPGFGDFLVRYAAGGPWPPGAFDGWKEGVTWNHLWYLAYLWAYTLLLAALLPLLDSAPGRRLGRAVAGLRGWRLLALPLLPFLCFTLVLWPHFPQSHDFIHDHWLHAVYFTLLLFGYWVGIDGGFWAEALRLRRRAAGLAVLAFGAIVLLQGAGLGGTLPGRQLLRMVADGAMWMAVLAVLGWAHAALNRPWPWLAWAGESVYPWYILHQTVLVVLIVQLAPLQLGPVMEPAVLAAGTVAGCWAMTAVVRRSRWLRPLLGLKPRARPPRLSPAMQGCPSVHSA